MSESHPPRKQVKDEDLLKNAISIDDLEEINDADSHGDEDLTPIDVDDTGLDVGKDASMGASMGGSMIQVFGGQRIPHEDHWARKPNITGKGAIHVKTFFCKLRPDAIENVDQQINEWLDKHPEYEVKFVTTTVGKLVGKNIEEALFLNVWV